MPQQSDKFAFLQFHRDLRVREILVVRFEGSISRVTCGNARFSSIPRQSKQFLHPRDTPVESKSVSRRCGYGIMQTGARLNPIRRSRQRANAVNRTSYPIAGIGKPVCRSRFCNQ